jgi:FAD/FMN-containing dehydrogenase
MSISTRPPVASIETVFVPELFSSLREHISGTVVTPRSEDYDEARTMLSFLEDRRPAAIVKAANASDVSVAIRFGRNHDLPVTVRSGGHSLAHYSVVNGGIVIDLSACLLYTSPSPRDRG